MIDSSKKPFYKPLPLDALWGLLATLGYFKTIYSVICSVILSLARFILPIQICFRPAHILWIPAIPAIRDTSWYLYLVERDRLKVRNIMCNSFYIGSWGLIRAFAIFPKPIPTRSNSAGIHHPYVRAKRSEQPISCTHPTPNDGWILACFGKQLIQIGRGKKLRLALTLPSDSVIWPDGDVNTLHSRKNCGFQWVTMNGKKWSKHGFDGATSQYVLGTGPRTNDQCSWVLIILVGSRLRIQDRRDS